MNWKQWTDKEEQAKERYYQRLEGQMKHENKCTWILNQGGNWVTCDPEYPMMDNYETDRKNFQRMWDLLANWYDLYEEKRAEGEPKE